MLAKLRTTVQKYQKQFQIVRILGEGSFGQVALVRHKYTKKQYALKFYSARQLQKNNKTYSLKRSMKILESLKSQKIIKLYSWADDQDKFIMQIEVCKRGNFQQFLKKYGSRLTENIQKFYIIQMTEILAYLKKQQVAHRDIKPANFVIDTEGHLKLVDFDEAITFDNSLFTNKEDIEIISQKFNRSRKNTDQILRLRQVQHLRSRQATYVGTACYMAPQLHNYSLYTQSGDIWSLGCIIYEILTKRKFMTDEDTFDLKQNLVFSTKYSKQAQDLLQKVLKRLPQQRLSLKQILQHEYLRQFNMNQQIKNETLLQIKKLFEKRQRYSSKAIIQEIKSSPFTQNFEIAQQIMIDLLILKKQWYFYYPKYLVTSKNSFKILNYCKTQTQNIIFFSEIQQIIFQNDTVIIKDNHRFYYMKVQYVDMQHIKYQNTKMLYQSIRNVLEQ